MGLWLNWVTVWVGAQELQQGGHWNGASFAQGVRAEGKKAGHEGGGEDSGQKGREGQDIPGICLVGMEERHSTSSSQPHMLLLPPTSEEEDRAKELRHEFFGDEINGASKPGEGGQEAEVQLDTLVEECKQLQRKLNLKA